MMTAVAAVLISILAGAQWVTKGREAYQSMVEPIGNALLRDYLLPFELISFVLLGALVGSVVLVRREVK
jgi:NADH-quinone oxidoreductase subunit J